MISEVRIVTLSVRDLARSLSFYGDVLGYELLARETVPSALSGPWRMPPGLAGETALLGAGGQRVGMLRLVAFDAPGESVWTQDNLLAGNGFYAVNFRGRDIRSLLPRMLAADADGPPEPKFWEVSDDVAVWDSITRDPDGIHLDIFTYARGGELRGPLLTEVSTVQTIAICTHDVARCQSFYQALGFEVLFDKVLEGLEDLLGVPEGVSIHNVNLMKDGHVVPGRVELFKYFGLDLPPAQDFTRRSAPPNHGILSASFETSDLAAASRTLVELGARAISDSVETVVAGLGALELQTFLGPDGECLEVYRLR